MENTEDRSVLLSSLSSLSLRMPVMNNKTYRHKGKPLTQSVAKEIISTKTYTSGSSITAIAKHVHKKHVELGGLPSEKDLEDIVKSTLRYLSQFGEANRITSDTWRIPTLNQQIFGSGKHWIYLYYFNEDKKKAKSDSTSPYDDEDDLFWPCKIGRADKNPEDRVKSQTSGVPVPPHIGLLLRTDEHVAL